GDLMRKSNDKTSNVTLNVADIADILGISRSIAYQLVRQKDFPKIRIGKRIIIPRDNFFSWLNRQAQRGEGN
ncbi:MAG: helix-turn-helix domain-containing protein, partial [Bacillota bacterium]